MTPQQIFNEGCAAAQAASDVSEAVQTSWYPCGFATIRIRPARGKFVSWCKANNIGRTSSYAGGYAISVYAVSKQSRGFEQSMNVKGDAARAFAKVLRDNGVAANAETRID